MLCWFIYKKTKPERRVSNNITNTIHEKYTKNVKFYCIIYFICSIHICVYTFLFSQSLTKQSNRSIRKYSGEKTFAPLYSFDLRFASLLIRARTQNAYVTSKTFSPPEIVESSYFRKKFFARAFHCFKHPMKSAAREIS